MPHFSLSVPLENPLERALDDERAHPRGVALLLLFQVAPGEHQEVIRNVGQRNPHLLAGQHVAVAFLDRHGLNAARVAAGRGFGQGETGDLRALRLRHQISLFLVLGSPREQRQTVQPGVHRHDHAQRRVDVFELLARHPERRCSPSPRRRTRRARRCPAARATPSAAESRDRTGARGRVHGSAAPPPAPAHSRTDCSSSRWSSVRSKFNMEKSPAPSLIPFIHARW